MFNLSIADQNNSKKSLEFFLKSNSLSLDEQVLQLIEKDDFIEVFDCNASQLFRSFNFFSINTYSLEDFSKKSFEDLYERPEFFTKLLLKSGNDVLSGKTNFLEKVCPKHIVKEKKINGAKVEINYKFMSSIKHKKTNITIGVLVCEKLKKINILED